MRPNNLRLVDILKLLCVLVGMFDYSQRWVSGSLDGGVALGSALIKRHCSGLRSMGTLGVCEFPCNVLLSNILMLGHLLKAQFLSS